MTLLSYEDIPAFEERVERVSLHFNKIAQRVYEALRADVRCRNNDRILLWTIWKEDLSQKGEPDLYIPELENFTGLTNPESVRRARAYIQNDAGLFLPTVEAVQHRRRISAKAVERWAVREADPLPERLEV